VIVVRAGLGTLVGIQRHPETEVWLAPGRETRLGSVFAGIADLLVRQGDEPPVSPRGDARAYGEECEACRACLSDAIARSGEVDSIALLRSDGEAFALRREVLDHSASLRLETSRAPILEVDAVAEETAEPGDSAVEVLGISHRSLVLGRHGAWHYGSCVPDGSGRSLWLTVSSRASQGLAWALLTASARQLARQPCALGGS
jgi:hypothetical protein